MSKGLRAFSLLAAMGFAAIVVTAVPVLAAPQPVVGKKLLIKNNTDATKNKTVILIKEDPMGPITAPGAQPTTGTVCISGGLPGPADDAELDVDDDADPGEWSTIGSGFKYKRGGGIPGDPCKVVLIKGGKLVKAVCKGSDVDYDVNNGGPVNVAIVAGTEKYCAAFGDTADPGACTETKDGSDGTTYLSKNCTAPGNCAAFAGTACSPSGAFLDAASLF
jgi:hypothetical protein